MNFISLKIYKTCSVSSSEDEDILDNQTTLFNKKGF